jgi:glutamate/aspartate transport system substrate-binding protein
MHQRLPRRSFTAVLIAISLVMQAPPACASESFTLRKIAESGVITIGFRDGSVPFSYLDAKRRPVGYSMDICYRIADAVKQQLKRPDLEVKLTPVTSATRVPLINNNIVDLECGTTSNTAERQKQVSYLVTTFVATGRLLTKRKSGINGLDDLRGKTVVSTAGTTSIHNLVELNASRKLEMNILAARDHAEAFQILETDRAVAFAMDDVLLVGLAAMSKKPDDYRVAGEPLSIEPYGVVVRKDDPEFKRLGDEAIVSMFRSGEIERLYRKWFQSPIPPKQVNLQLPMSPQLRKAIVQPSDSGDPNHYR